MTIKELYEWAKELGIEGFEIRVQYRDEGGYYPGTDSISYSDVEIEYSERNVIV